MRYGWKVLGALLLVAACGGRLSAEEKTKADPKADPALIKRGAYLVNEVARCGDCHTPRNAKGELDMKRHLQGAPMWFTPKVKPGEEWEDKAPDITMSGKVGQWSEAEMIKFMSTGADPKGEKPDAPMPAYKLSPDDARAVTAYLRSLPGGGKKEGEKKEGEKKEGGKKEGEKKEGEKKEGGKKENEKERNR
jgi:mono/diheme cytochrome c family protein